MKACEAILRLRDIKKIIKLAGKSYSELIKMNAAIERACISKRTKAQLIYQLLYFRDAPEE